MSTSIKLCTAFRGAESPQLLLTSHGTKNLQHLKKKNKPKTSGTWSRWGTKLCCVTFLFYCSSVAAFLVSLWSPQTLIWSLRFCTSVDAPSLTPRRGEQSEQCSCSPYPKGMVTSCYNISTLNLQRAGFLRKKNAIERIKTTSYPMHWKSC